MSSNHFGIFALKSESDTDSSMNSLKQSNTNKINSSSKQSSTRASFSSGGEEQQPSIDPQICRVPTLFEWKGKNETVFLTGSFCNWKQKFQMPKITDDLFQITLALSKSFATSAGASACSSKTSERDVSGVLMKKFGFWVVAPIRTTMPSSTYGSRTSCWDLLKR